MLGITIVICVFLFMTTALILSTIENKSKINNELLDILENLNERLKILEKKKILLIIHTFIKKVKMMKKQYKEYKTLDKDISDLIIYDDNMFLSLENEIEFIEDINDFNLLELKKYIIEKIDNGDFINLLEKLCRNRLMKIIPMLVLDEKEYEIYSLFYKNRETQSEIGKKIGVTRQSISKVLKKINGKFDYASQNITNHYHEQVM